MFNQQQWQDSEPTSPRKPEQQLQGTPLPSAAWLMATAMQRFKYRQMAEETLDREINRTSVIGNLQKSVKPPVTEGKNSLKFGVSEILADRVETIRNGE